MVRNATIQDIDRIVEFNLNLAIETESKVLDGDIVRKGVLKILKGEVEGKYFVYEIDGTIVGQMMILYEWSDWRNGTFIWIQSVYVDKKYRGMSIFKKLFDHVKNYCNSNEKFIGLRLYVDKENINAMRAYSTVGMYESNYNLYEYMK